MTRVPHRIGGTRHKFPENSPFHPNTSRPVLDFLPQDRDKKSSFSELNVIVNLTVSGNRSARSPAQLAFITVSLSDLDEHKAIGTMEMVRKKIQILQQQLDEAEDRELAVQKEYDTERGLREVVRNDSILFFFQFIPN